MERSTVPERNVSVSLKLCDLPFVLVCVCMCERALNISRYYNDFHCLQVTAYSFNISMEELAD